MSETRRESRSGMRGVGARAHAEDPPPIDAYRSEILSAMTPGSSLLLAAEPGAGKTTRVPLWLLGTHGPLPAALQDTVQRVWWLTAPRRMAARAAAERLAAGLGERVGQRIGLHTRDDHVESKQTRVLVMTEGMALRRLIDDPSLEGLAGVLLDEFHERSATVDVLLALLRQSRALFNESARLVLMSASIEGDALRRAWCRVGPDGSVCDLTAVTVPGRGYPLHIQHVTEPAAGPDRPRDSRWVERLADTIAAVLAGRLRDDAGARVVLDHDDAPSGGDVLIFLPGLAEIRRLSALLRGVVPAGDPILTLYSGTPPERQREVLEAQPVNATGRPQRRWILATDVAETSLTIEGVRTVIDPGLHRRPRFDPNAGLSRLETRWITQANAIQRAGRAGRTAPGRVLRLYSADRLQRWPSAQTPALQTSDLADTVMALAAYGAAPDELDWLDAPPAGAYEQARDLLRRFGALDARGAITAHGQRLWAAGTSPRLAQLVLAAAEASARASVVATVTAAARLAARLEEPPVTVDAGRHGLDLREQLAALNVTAPGFTPTGSRHASAAMHPEGAAMRARMQRRIAGLTRLALDAVTQTPSGAPSRSLDPDQGFVPLTLDTAGLAALDQAMMRAFPDRVVLSETWLARRSVGPGVGQSVTPRDAPAPVAPGARTSDLTSPAPARRFQLASGRWLVLRAGGPDTLASGVVAGVAVEIAGAESPRHEARVRRFWPLDESALREAPGLATARTLRWNAEAGRVEAWLETRLDPGAEGRADDAEGDCAAGSSNPGLCLERRRVPFEAGERAQIERVLLEGAQGALAAGAVALDGDAPAAKLAARLEFLRRLFGDQPVEGIVWPRVSIDALLAEADDWLAPMIPGCSRLDELEARDPLGAWPVGLWLMHRDPRIPQALERLAPTHWTLPSGRRAPINYDPMAEPPAARVAGRVQEWFGTRETPMIAAGRVALTIELCSPAGRPAAVTRDLASFWAQGYFDVRKDLRGRYPKHPWPDDPLSAPPTQRAKPRGS